MNGWQIPNVTQLAVLRGEIFMPVQQRDSGRSQEKQDQHQRADRLHSKSAPVGHTLEMIV
jgi:hypothetical protein